MYLHFKFMFPAALLGASAMAFLALPAAQDRGPGRSDKPIQDGKSNSDAESEEGEFEEPSEVDWDLLSFGETEGKRLTSIELKFTEEDVAFLKKYHGFSVLMEPTTITITDPAMLEAAEFYFRPDQCLKQIIPKGWHGGWSGAGFPVGELKLKTTSGELLIGITCLGFGLNSRGVGIENRFFAPAASEFLSTVYCQKHGVPLPDQLTEILSGANEIRSIRGNLLQNEAKRFKPL